MYLPTDEILGGVDEPRQRVDPEHRVAVAALVFDEVGNIGILSNVSVIGDHSVDGNVVAFMLLLQDLDFRRLVNESWLLIIHVIHLDHHSGCGE